MKTALYRTIGIALVQLFLQGAGYVRLGQFRRLLYLWGITLVAVILIPLVIPVGRSPIGLFLVLSLFFGAWIFCVFDAGRIAYKSVADTEFKMKPWWLVVGYLIVIYPPTSMIASNKSSWLGYDTFRMPSITMEPAIKRGEMIVVDTRAYLNEPIKIGDVIVVGDQQSGLKFIRRVSKIENNAIAVAVDNTAWVAEGEKGLVTSTDVVGKVAYIWFSSEISRIASTVK